jgi:hypothetical protein
VPNFFDHIIINDNLDTAYATFEELLIIHNKDKDEDLGPLRHCTNCRRTMNT